MTPSEYGRRKLAEARAILASTRSTNCRHGVRPSQCAEHRDKPDQEEAPRD